MIRPALLALLTVALAGCASMRSVNEPLPAAMLDKPDQYVLVTLRNDDPKLGGRAGSTLRGYDNVAPYTAGSSARSAIRSLTGTYHLREVSAWPIATLSVHCIVFQIPADMTAAQVITRLRQDGRVESAQPLHAFSTQSEPYNDPYEKLQRSLSTMNVAAAHRWSRGAGVHVAIIDTGMDTAHPDLAGRIVEKRDFVDSDWTSFATDRHGTAVAGVIAANANNAMGIVGVAPEALLHAYKACWQKVAGASAADCNSFTLAKALSAAIDARVSIMNLSLAGPTDELLTRLVKQARQRGIIVVGATPAGRPAGFPGDIEGVISVAATERAMDGARLMAPGAEVLTLVPGNHYDFASGSSIAAANVSGVIALLLAKDRGVSSTGLLQLLTSTSSHADDGAQSGSVNAVAALCTLVKDDSCNDAGALSIAAK
jgi:Subtilase family